MNAISFDLSSKSNGWSFTAERKIKSAFPSVAETALHNTAETFAADISRRIAGTAMPEPATGKAQDEAASAENFVYGVTRQDLKDLESALAGVINNIVEKFGVKAGNIAQALVYKKIGEDEVTEDNLAGGLLDALKFIDKQFGPEAGDELIAFMNRGVNKELNEFFDNGHNEEFYVSTDAAAAANNAAAAGGQMLANWMEKTAGEGEGGGGASLMDILKQLAKELEEKLQEQMRNASPDLDSADISSRMTEQLAAYAAQSAPEDFAPGTLLTQSV